MVLSLEKKREIIVKNKSPALAAINGYLDKMYYLTDEITEKKKILKMKKLKNLFYL